MVETTNEGGAVADVLLVRAGDDIDLVDDFMRGGYVAVGWSRLADVSDLKDSATDLEELLAGSYGTGANGRPIKHILEFIDFVQAKPGGWIATVDRGRRKVLVGRLESDYYFAHASKLRSGGEVYRHFHNVVWNEEVGRDQLSDEARKDLDQRGKTAFYLKPETGDELLRVAGLA